MVTITKSSVQTESGLHCQLLAITIGGSGITTPDEFAREVEALAPVVASRAPTLITGKAPVWGYAMLCHAAHATPAVATFDPRLGFVIVESHDVRFKTGDIFEPLMAPD